MSENARLLGESARLGEERCSLLQLAVLELGPRFAAQRSELEIFRSSCPGGVPNLRELRRRNRVLAALAKRRCAGELRLPTAALVRGDPRLEQVGVDSELLRQPRNGLRGGPRLAALDLAQVLLAEAARCEVGLRKARRGAEFAQANAEPCRDVFRALRLFDSHGHGFSLVLDLPPRHTVKQL